VAWLKDQLGLIQSAAESESIAGSVPDNGGVYLVPAFAGLSAPHWSPGARAAIVGLSGGSTRAHIVRAALESIAYQARDVVQMMRDRAGVQLATIHADGGATRNRMLMQFIADMTGLEVNVADIPDCSPLGAAMAGMLGMGVAPSLQALRNLPRRETPYRPAMDRAQADRLYRGWHIAVSQVLEGIRVQE
jgi:glycerol kinase